MAFPAGVTAAPRGRQLLVLQAVVETVSRSPAASPGTPAGIGRARCAALTCAPHWCGRGRLRDTITEHSL